MKLLIAPVLTALFIGAVLTFLTFSSASRNTDAKPDGPGSLASLQKGDYPWSVGLESLKDRLNAAGLPALKSEGSVLHTHQHLDIFVDGNRVNIPQGIGVNDAAGFISPIHTHEADGIIHVESPNVQTFTLGQFFNVWGVRFDDNCLGSYCLANNKKLRVFVNGRQLQKGFQDLALEPQQEIVITYGTDGQLPNPLPKSFNFLPGY